MRAVHPAVSEHSTPLKFHLPSDRIGKRLPMATAIYLHLEDYDQALSKNRL